jgi:hypothetical protein
MKKIHFDSKIWFKAEHKSRKNCEKSLVIFYVFVNIAFHVKFFTSTFPEISCLEVHDTISSIDERTQKAGAILYPQILERL